MNQQSIFNNLLSNVGLSFKTAGTTTALPQTTPSNLYWFGTALPVGPTSGTGSGISNVGINPVASGGWYADHNYAEDWKVFSKKDLDEALKTRHCLRPLNTLDASRVTKNILQSLRLSPGFRGTLGGWDLRGSGMAVSGSGNLTISGPISIYGQIAGNVATSSSATLTGTTTSTYTNQLTINIP